MARPRKNAGPSLDAARVVDAALQIIDAEGLDALSMRRLGQALGVEAPSIYRLVPGKAALLDAVYDAVAQELAPIHDAADWADHLRRLARGWRALLLRHPNLLPLFSARPPHAPRWLAEAEGALAALRGAGFSSFQAIYLYKTLAAIVIGHAANQAAPPPPGDALDQPAWDAAAAAQLPAAQLPVLSATLAEAGGRDFDAWFDFALDLFIAGARGVTAC